MFGTELENFRREGKSQEHFSSFLLPKVSSERESTKFLSVIRFYFSLAGVEESREKKRENERRGETQVTFPFTFNGTRSAE